MSLEEKFWLILREPGCVPDLKGPWPHAMTKMVLREFLEARPSAFVTVLTIHANGPDVQDGPHCLEMLDGRSKYTARRHRVTSAAAFRQPERRASHPAVLTEIDIARLCGGRT